MSAAMANLIWRQSGTHPKIQLLDQHPGVNVEYVEDMAGAARTGGRHRQGGKNKSMDKG